MHVGRTNVKYVKTIALDTRAPQPQMGTGLRYDNIAYSGKPRVNMSNTINNNRTHTNNILNMCWGIYVDKTMGNEHTFGLRVSNPGK